MRQLSVSIDCPAAKAYEFLSLPENLLKWAPRLGASLRLTERNSRGVLDYSVTLPNGSQLYVPLRVVADGGGCQLVLTLFRPPEMADEEHGEALLAAKRILETRRAARDPAPGNAGSSWSSVMGNSRTRRPVAL